MCIACSFALGKFLFFHYNLCCVYLHAVPVGVAARLDTPADNDLDPLSVVSLRMLSLLSEGNAGNEIRALLSVTLEPAVYSQCNSGDGQRVLSL